MKKLLVLFGIISAFAVSAFAQGSPPTPPPLALKVGDMAPDFNLPSTAGGRVKLSDFRGKNNVVLAFFVLAFTGGWTKEMQAYQADIAKFDAANTKVFGISMDAIPSLKAFGEKISVTTVPMLSDWGRTATKDYGLFNEKNGYGRRATFVVDKDGKITHIEVDNVAVDPTGAFEACSLLEKKLVVKPPADKP